MRPCTCRRPGHVGGLQADAQRRQAQRGVPLDRAADEHRLGLGGELGPLRQHVVDGGLAGPVQHHAEGAAVVVLDDVDHAAAERRLQQIGVGEQQRSRADPVRRGSEVVLRVL